MTITNAILNYSARLENPFKRKDLFTELLSEFPQMSESSLAVMINKLVADGRLSKVGHGLYKLPSSTKREYIYPVNDEIAELNKKLKERFPFADFCIWQPSAFVPFMQHIPSNSQIFIDVEKDVAESMFSALQEINLDMSILFKPSELDCKRYLSNGRQIIVRNLATESPVMKINDIMVPKIEKMLVDAIADNELKFLQGAELYTIYQNAFEQCNISKSTLLRYATRRSRKKELNTILNTLIL